MKIRDRLAGVRTGLVLNGAIAVLFLIVAGTAVLVVNRYMRQQALVEAQAKARMLLDRNLATHTYFSHDLKPDLFAWTEPFRDEDYFDPVWMSSTYAVRKMDEYARSLSATEYYYKETAINARSPENEADSLERAFLQELNAEPDLTEQAFVRWMDGEPFFVTMRRGETMEASCLRCHSTPEVAPAGLVEEYGPVQSFHREVGDTVSAISIRIPLSAAYGHADRFSVQLSGLLLAVLGGLFVAQTVLSRWFVLSPVARIRNKARQIADGDEHLGEQIPEPVGKELRDLTLAFNAMSARLRQGILELEARVAERTASLVATNEQLGQEIARRRETERTLRDSAAFLNATGRMARVGGWEVDADTLAVRWTEETYRIHEVPLDYEPPLQEAIDFFHPEDRDRLADAIQRALDEGEPYDMEIRFITATGKELWTRTICEPEVVDGRTVRLRGTFQDITTRKQMEEALRAYSEGLEEMVAERTHELQEAQEELLRKERLAVLGQLAGGVSHELRQPLGVIKNAVYYLRMVHDESDGTLREYVDIVGEEVARAEAIVSDLLDLGRAPAAGRALTAVGDLIRRALARRPVPAGVDVVVEVPAGMPSVYVDAQQIEQVLDNLLTNAYQAMPNGGRLTIAARAKGKDVAISVTDTGGGIAPEHMGKLFEPLFTTKAQGIGLGLAIAREYVQANQGTIDVQSREGEGSRFTIALPTGQD